VTGVRRVLFRSEPNTDFHQIVADIIEMERKPAKTINFGIIYGMGKNKMANDMGISLQETEKLLKTYHSTLPFAKGLSSECTDYANKRGWIKTILGRRRRFNLYEPRKNKSDWDNNIFYEATTLADAKEKYPDRILQRAMTYKALNSLVQGSAADMTKKAIVNIYKETGHIAALQVHDELDFTDLCTIDNADKIKQIKEIMESAIPLTIPIIADCEIGKSWGELHEYK
jgi:DNA polymerase I-like protein with 3'-5' exonuclease and polymerase domains